MQTFTDAINSQDIEDELDNPNFWINKGRQEDEGHNLAELCILHNNSEALATLVRLGVHMDLLNPVTGFSALHRAAELASPHLLSIILRTTKHTFDVNTRAAKRKKGLTALHLACSKATEDHLK